MKSIISKSTFLLAFALILFTSCKDGESSGQSESGTQITDVSSSNRGQAFMEDDESVEPNALRIAIGSPDHTTLVAAVQAAGVENSLVNVGPLTVFAPTNAAFDKIDKATLDHLLKPENKSELALILQHHVAPGNYSIETLERSAERGRNLGMASNQSIDVTKQGDDIYVGGVKIVATVQASNGWVHIVEEVILPKN
jgi:uncharacterized surface protein with fasciclin (FAS1) repeats